MPIKLTLEEMHKIAQERGGRCLSTVYVNSKTKLLWECSEGHQWETIPNAIKNGTWCPRCAKRGVGLSLNDMVKLAAERGGKCLSTTYKGSGQKLLWECSKGHQWCTTQTAIKRGTWCPHCAGVAKHTLKKMRHVAKERSGKCLSRTYKNALSKLLWECSEGHQWEATPNGIMSGGTWCPTCYLARRYGQSTKVKP